MALNHWLILLITLPSLTQVVSIVTNNTLQINTKDDNIPRKHLSDTNNKSTDSSDRNLMSDRDNATFYYDPDSFLIPTTKSVTRLPGNVDKSINSSRDISARNGRMLDLDELVGDFEQAKLNKQNRNSGYRQSRILSDSPIDLGNGKKLSIQGFIPIMTIKDLNSDDKDDNRPSETISKKTSLSNPNHEDNAQLNQHFASLPFAQSSPGHASVGLKPYSENYDDNQMATINANYLQQQQQQQQQLQNFQQSGVDAKYLGGSGSSSLNSFKKPQNKKLAASSGLSMLNSIITGGPLSGLSSNVKTNNNAMSVPTTSSSQDIPDASNECVCVPFYMCRGGHLSESSLTKDQVQQLIQSQQQTHNQQTTLSQYLQGKQSNNELYSSQVTNNQQQQQQQQQTATQTVPLQQQQQLQQQQNQLQQDSYVPVDERSMDKQIGDNQSNLNETYQLNNNSELNSKDEAFQTSTNNPLNIGGLPQYSQDILGRMLGIKNEANSCGVLRTCCKVIMKSSTQSYGSGHRVASLGQLQSSQNNNNELIPYQQLSKSVAQQQMPISLQGVQHQQLQQQTAMQNSNNNMAFNQAYQDSFAHRHQLTNNRQQQSPQMSPLLQPNLNYKSSQPYIQAPLNHQMNQYQSQPVAMASTQLQSYQPTNKFYGPSPIYSEATQIQSQYLSNPSQVAQYNNQLTGPLRNQLIETNHVVGQLAYQQSQIAPAKSSHQNQLSNQKRMLEGRCGVRNAAGITGRVQNLQYELNSADFGEYPSQVAILKRLAGSDSLYVCAGTLISQRWIATAAHCIKKYTNIDLKVRLGEWDVHRDDEFYPFVESNIRDIVIHPEFVAGNLVNDIALLRMESMVDASLPHIGPACLPNSDEIFTGLRCWVTGWGKDTFGHKGSFQSVLKEVDLPITSHRDCEQALRQTRLGQHYRLHAGFICAGGEGGKDACEGDGGSGLYCVQDGIIKAVGLVSWGIGCGQAGVPGVYVNLAHYRVWIENIISIDEDLYGPLPGVLGSNSLISERSPSSSTNANSSTITSEQEALKVDQTISEESRSANIKKDTLPDVTMTSTESSPMLSTTVGPRNDSSQINEPSSLEFQSEDDFSDLSE